MELRSIGGLLLMALLPGVLPLEYDCPLPWLEHGGICYKFSIYPTSLQAAEEACGNDGANLVSVNDGEEHYFITTWLDNEDDTLQMWYTSGRQTNEDAQQFFWEGDGRNITGSLHWLDPDNLGEGDRIVYSYEDFVWGWKLIEPNLDLPYICEIPKEYIYQIVEEERDFMYGLSSTDPAAIMRGPFFVQQPQDFIYDVDSADPVLSIECVAEGNPQVDYTWMLEREQISQVVNPAENDRYTIINGKLIIHNPDQNQDNGDYQCIARNMFGSILSNSVQISFGYLLDFPRTTRDPIRVEAFGTVGIDCNPPNHYPDILYAWYKDDPYNFVTSITKPYLFISRNGKLYFSSVTNDDEGDYHCHVSSTLTGATSSGGKVSTAIELIVRDAVASTREPQIASGFPAAYPSSPKLGDDVAIECFASGTDELIYNWVRQDAAMPEGVYFTEYKRVLHLPNVQLLDAGIYVCTCTRINGHSNSAAIQLHIDAEPFFTIPLKDQHIDIGGTMRLQCIASGIPAVSYSWIVNSTVLDLDNIAPEQRDRYEVLHNSLTIYDMGPNDQGMYQCAATNLYGTRYSAAQVRVLAFAPTFEKNPLQANTYGSRYGNATILCNPEAAPRPTKEWQKNGVVLSFSNNQNGNIMLLPNGNLLFVRVQNSNAGTYTCVASNIYGTASSSGNLTVLTQTTIISTPTQNSVIVNGTAFIPCQASYNPLLDVTYMWYHNDREVEFIRVRYIGNEVAMERDEHYSRGTGINSGGLYIHNAQFFHEGRYKCVVETSSQEIFREVDLYVHGPPSMPVAVQGSQVTESSIHLTWVATRNNGAPILSYIVEGFNSYEGQWKEVKSNVVGRDRDNTETTVEGLDAYSTYAFRIRAVNQYGIGEPSGASSQYTTAQAPPATRVRNVGGGGGKVGTLVINWEPLEQWEYNGEGLKYMVQWKKHILEEDEWDEEIIQDPTVGTFTALVFSENYYTRYDVQVVAFNNVGEGPEPVAPVTIWSAEDIPNATPTNVQATQYNGTALLVTWNPVEDTPEKIKGVLLGYRINYWKEVGETEEMSIYRPLAGQRDHGLIIGLEPHTYYFVNVQVFNSAGNGPKSQNFLEETLRSPPKDAPTEVSVTASDDNTINVKWRGVDTNREEEPLQGYLVRYWRASESYYMAEDVDANRENHIRVTGLQPDVLYNLRVLGYSLGGEGLPSSPIIQFMLGPNCQVFQASPERRFVYTCGGSVCRVSYLLMLLPLTLQVVYGWN